MQAKQGFTLNGSQKNKGPEISEPFASFLVVVF